MATTEQPQTSWCKYRICHTLRAHGPVSNVLCGVVVLFHVDRVLQAYLPMIFANLIICSRYVFSSSSHLCTVSQIHNAFDLAVGFSIDRFDEAKGFTGEKFEEVKGFSGEKFHQITEFLGPIFDNVRLKIVAVVVNMPLIGNEIVVDKSKGDAPTASTASLQTLDTGKEAKKEDYDEFLKMMEK